MSEADAILEAEPSVPGRKPGRLPLEREFRLWAGVVLFAFVVTHLLNHAVGVAGLDAMQAVQRWRVALWQSLPGTILLYGACLVHAGLALKRLARRRTLRMPLDEGIQILFGLAIPYFLLGHVGTTRIAALVDGADQSYFAVVWALWGDPAVQQILFVVIAWTHGCIGLAHVMRSRPAFERGRIYFAVFAAVVPVLAIAGFVTAGREAHMRPAPPAYQPSDGVAQFPDRARLAYGGLLVFLAAGVGMREMLRRRGGGITVRYTGHGDVRATRGLTILEISRLNHIPHPALCRGRARCSACRIAVTEGIESLPPPEPPERTMLVRLSAPANVRLGCQLRPTADLSIQILLPILPRGGQQHDLDDAFRWGAEREVSVMFVDIRAFTALTRRLLPYDITLVINAFIKQMRQAAEAHDGRVDSVMTDRLMAIFGLADSTGAGAREAVLAAQDMLKAAAAMNEEFQAALPIPLRIGIGIHTGPAVIAEVGDEERGLMVTALGDTVSIASRLEAATKEFMCDCLVSTQTAKASRLNLPRHEGKVLHMQGLDMPIELHRLEDEMVLTKMKPGQDVEVMDVEKAD